MALAGFFSLDAVSVRPAAGRAPRLCIALGVSVEPMASMPAVDDAARTRPMKTGAPPVGGAPA